MQKLKLLIFHPVIAPYRVDLFNALNENFILHLYLFRKNLLSQHFDMEKILGQINFKPNYITKGFEITKKKRIFRLGYLSKIAKHKPNIIICIEYGLITMMVSFYARLFYKKTKVLTICDDSIDIAINCSGLRKIARTICMKLLHGIILTNDNVKEWYAKNYPTLSSVVFPIIQEEEYFFKKINSSIDIAQNYSDVFNLDNKQIFLYVGRLTEVKNLEFLIEVFVEYAENKNDVALILVGDGNLKDKLINLANTKSCSDKILFPGRFENEDLYAWYHLANYFILPSTYEPFGAVVNEALMAGLPVLCSNLAGSASLISSKNGYTFNPKDKNELLALLNKTITIKRPISHSIIESLMPFIFKDRFTDLQNFLISHN